MERTTATNTHLAGDAALVERARDGDQEAFTALVDARLSTTYRTASAFLGNEVDAREVTEEIFVRAWRDLPELPAPDGFGAWFSRIVDEACRTAALDRRRGKVRELSVTAGPAGTPTSGTLRGQILQRVATTKQRSGPRPAAVAAASLERPDRVSTSRRKRLGIGIPVIVLLTVALVAIIGQRMQPPQTPFKSGLVAFVRDGDVYMANADGTGATRIVHQDGLAMSAVVWSPDGRRVAIDGDAGTILYDTSTGTSTHIGGTQPGVLAGRPADRRHRFRRGRAPAPPAGPGVGGRDEAPDRHDRRPRVVTRWPVDRGSRIGRQPRHRRIHQLREDGRVEWTGPRRRSGHDACAVRCASRPGRRTRFASRSAGAPSPATDAGATRCATRTSSRQTRTGPGSCS